MTRLRAPAWAMLVAGCATLTAHHARERELERQLAAAPCPEPLDRAWQEARRLLAERGYPLADKDADAVGQSRMSQLERILTPARETVERGPFDRSLETGWTRARDRYSLQALPTPGGCQIVLWHVDEAVDGRPTRPTRDLELELELVRRVDPAAAARIDAALSAPAATSR